MQQPPITPPFKRIDVINDLQSKQNAYLTLSASLALLVGTLSVFLAACLWIQSQRGTIITNLNFYLLWTAVAALCTAVFFIMMRPRFSKTPGLSPRIQAVFLLIAPALICGTLIPLWLALTGHRQTYITTLWMLFYGLALLSTASFAPQTIIALGWGFLTSGLLAIAVVLFGHDLRVHDTRTAALFMFWTFGLLHLLYGIGVHSSLRNKKKTSD